MDEWLMLGVEADAEMKRRWELDARHWEGDVGLKELGGEATRT
jgi:hypothetical protein